MNTRIGTRYGCRGAIHCVVGAQFIARYLLVESDPYGSLPAATMRLYRILGEIQTTRSSKVGVGVWLTKVLFPLELSFSSELLLAGSCVPCGVHAPAPFLPAETMTAGTLAAMVVPPVAEDSTFKVPHEHNAKLAFCGLLDGVHMWVLTQPYVGLLS